MNIVGIGCDILRIERLKKNQEGIAKRVLHEKELELYQGFKGERKLEFLAGRFAAKEALFKAFPIPYPLKELRIQVQQEKTYCEIEHHYCYVTISHEKDYVLAYALCVEV